MTRNESPSAVATLGERVRRLRLAAGLTQTDLAARAGMASGAISMIENGRFDADADDIASLSDVLDCDPAYLLKAWPVDFDRPKLRAYADAPQRVVDRTMFDSVAAVEVIRAANLRVMPVSVPVFDGDLNDDDAIDRIAADTRTAAGLTSTQVIPSVIRAAERLGCLVLPLDGELGRHLGMSLTVDGTPVIRVARPSRDPESDLPGDRQRFTVAHELGHLVLHAGATQPAAPAEAARMEREANRFAAAFLVPGDSALEDLHHAGGRVTLGTMATLKQKWGYSIKAFVFRFRELGVIDEAQARSLYKQISARRWNRDEPFRPGNESAVWLKKALRERFPGPSGHDQAAEASGLGARYLSRWLDWEPTGTAMPAGELTVLPIREVARPAPKGPARIARLPVRPDPHADDNRQTPY
ncbi:helix-turn-helix domain-containing protein [Frondihabitans australicus]|uniref:Zn-dependent peptidase ImmA (M78 family) n=1 Tax=Frondihabitans australicus TaxID=386892 RepID=A0A495ILQ8_9MICO|nr:ImmA/IrrE family metallo-endopeptidase [Frondihabitans australicus]RKR76368.1 Zn-dependent peptidase ImmA (M78 family) [Frondihabitans australicus]